MLGVVSEVVDDLVAAAQHGGDVELPAGGLGGARHAARLGERLRRSQQRLGGHAGVERALAADQLALDERDGEAVLGQAPGADLAGGPGAEDDHVEVFCAHERLLIVVERTSQVARSPLAKRHASGSLR